VTDPTNPKNYETAAPEAFKETPVKLRERIEHHY
jgi:hypothetical protein